MSTINSITPQPNLPISANAPQPRAPGGEERGARPTAPEAAGAGEGAVLQDRVEASETPARDVDSVFASLQGEAPTDADAARLLALNIRQQLQGREEAIANLRPNSVLSLLR